MKLRAQIVVDIDAVDYAAAAEHQRQLELVLEQMKARYVTAQLQIRERRERTAHLASEEQFTPRIAQVTSRRK
jgi:hypothetical protein